MPTRLWGDVQRARYGRFPDAIGEDDIARCFQLAAQVLPTLALGRYG